MSSSAGPSDPANESTDDESEDESGDELTERVTAFSGWSVVERVLGTILAIQFAITLVVMGFDSHQAFSDFAAAGTNLRLGLTFSEIGEFAVAAAVWLLVATALLLGQSALGDVGRSEPETRGREIVGGWLVTLCVVTALLSALDIPGILLSRTAYTSELPISTGLVDCANPLLAVIILAGAIVLLRAPSLTDTPPTR